MSQTEVTMTEETLSPKERWMAVLNREKPDRIPMDYWATDETTNILMNHLECENKFEMFKKLHIDKVIKLEPEYIGPTLSPGYDVFGCQHQDMDYGTGIYDECISHPLEDFQSVEEIKKRYTWPDPDWWDYSSVKRQIKGKEIYPLEGGNYEPFLIYKDLRGSQNAFMDLVENPEMVHFCLDQLLDLIFTQIRRIYEQIPGQIMLTYVAEDMGAQEDLMFSPSHIQEFLLPRMKKIIDYVHQQGAFVFHHNDGSIRRIIPPLIETGIDILNPIQWRCQHMERNKLKKDFGDKIIFHGAMDNQQTLPFGTTKDVENEVLENLKILGKDGGYILAPCHNLQPNTPVENILALYETGYEYGWT